MNRPWGSSQTRAAERCTSSRAPIRSRYVGSASTSLGGASSGLPERWWASKYGRQLRPATEMQSRCLVPSTSWVERSVRFSGADPHARIGRSRFCSTSASDTKPNTVLRSKGVHSKRALEPGTARVVPEPLERVSCGTRVHLVIELLGLCVDSSERI